MRGDIALRSAQTDREGFVGSAFLFDEPFYLRLMRPILAFLFPFIPYPFEHLGIEFHMASGWKRIFIYGTSRKFLR